jgi:acetyl-CoA C-acetyltransferase
MSTKGKAYIAGVWEHPLRRIPHLSTAQVHAECALGALADAGLSKDDVDGYFCAGDAPGFGPLSMAEYMGLRLSHVDSTETGGSSYVVHAGHAVEAIAAGKCKVALITLAGRPIGARSGLGTGNPNANFTGLFSPHTSGGGISETPESGFEQMFGGTTHNLYAMCAMRHMYEFGTTAEQLAWVKVAASHHAQWNEQAMRREVVSVEDVLASPMIADPLHRLDCCVISDGGGAVILVAPEIARSLNRPRVKVIGHGEAPKHPNGGRALNLTHSAAVWSGPRAFAEAGVAPADVKYASIYDSFTISVIVQLEDLGFCKKGEGGRFVAEGGLISGVGRLAVNTDGGGLCNNHPTNRGGITKIIEAVRQLRGEAHPKVQVPNCDIAVAQGTGGYLGTRHGSGTLIMEREQ